MQTLVVQVVGGRCGPDPVDNGWVPDLAPGALPAGDQEHVQRRMTVQRVVRQDPHALGAADRRQTLADEHDGVGVDP